MKIVESLKILFYFLLLVAGLFVVKLLSDFEFSLRDKTITYEEAWSVDFSRKLKKDHWESETTAYEKDRKKLVMFLPDELDENKLVFSREIRADSGYFEIKLKCPARKDLKAGIRLTKRDGSDALILPLENTSGSQRIKSPMIGVKNLEALEFSLTRNEESEALDEEKQKWANDEDADKLKVSELKFIKQVRQEKVF